MSREPLCHFFAWSQKNTDNHLLFRLVTGKADEFMGQFEKLIRNVDQWFNEAVHETDAQLSGDLLGVTRELALKLVVTGAGGFELRVRSQCKKWPLKLLWLSSKPPLQKCGKRMSCLVQLELNDFTALSLQHALLASLFCEHQYQPVPDLLCE